MNKTAADIFVEAIFDWGIDTIFGIPGDGNLGIVEALRKRQDKIKFIHVRHEESAAFMAGAYAKYTGKIAACLSTGGPGAIHLLNGLYDAKVDGQPVLAITGNTQHDLMGTYGQQDVWLDHLFSDVAVHSTRIMGAAHVETAVDIAVRQALAHRGVAHITFSNDLQNRAADSEVHSFRNIPGHTSDVRSSAAGLPNPVELQRAAELLNAGQRVAILAGQGALGARTELEQIAELLGAPVAKALLGKAVLPDDSPYTTGTIGHLGTLPTYQAMESCDTLLIVGSTFPFNEFYPKPGQARAVQIDIAAGRIGLRYPAEIGLVGDSQLVLEALIPLLNRKEDRRFLDQAQAGMRAWNQRMERIGTDPSMPLKPQVVAWELAKRLSGDAIVSSDSGNITHWWARNMPVKAGQMHSVSGNLGSMACSMPYAIAAQLAYPERQSIAIIGDGGFSMLMGEFATAVQYNLPIKVVVFKNNILGAIRWEQVSLYNTPEYLTELSPVDHVAVARSMGAAGFLLDDPATVGQILDEALAHPGPVIIEAEVDPDEIPVSPQHLT
jgi:pyruvate dehydrogenase (quinone)